MRHVRRTAKTLVLLACITPFFSTPPALTARQANDSRIKRVENGLRPFCWALFGDEERCTILERMKFYKVPGVSLAVIQNGRLAWAKGYGVKDFATQEPVTVGTLFQAASISKPLNATVIMKKVEQGKLELDADVNGYLRSWQVPANEFTAKEKVTISRLLSHTAGICNFNDRTGYVGYKTTDPLPTVQQMLRGEPPALTPPVTVEMLPGQAFRYANPGDTILQLVLMEMENKPYQQIMKETVLDPLGMGHSVFMQPLPDSLKSSAASAHDGWRPLEGKCMVYPELAAAGLWTTPSDLAKFIIEHWLSLKGKSNKIISRETAQRMIALLVEGSDYSEAFEVTRKGDEIYYGHRGGNYGFYANMIIGKNSGNGAVVMVNGGGDAINSNLKREILNSIAAEYGWQDYLPPVLKIVPVAPEKIERLTGRFDASADTVLEIKETGGRFTVQSPDRGVTDIFPVAEGEWVARSVLPLRYKLLKEGNFENDTLLEMTPTQETRARRSAAGKMIPYEYLASGNIAKAIGMYKELRQEDPAQPDVRENRINRLGYALLNENKIHEAIALFKLNTEWYPQSANTYDSLGEACLKAGDKELAIENYAKALQLNPGSGSAKDALKRLRENK